MFGGSIAHAASSIAGHRGDDVALLKDLAGLDKCGSQYCTRSERLDFAKTYLGKKSIDPETLTLARDVTRYRRERWPEDWNGR